MICDIGDLRPGTPAPISAANARAVHGRPTDLAGPGSLALNVILRYSVNCAVTSALLIVNRIVSSLVSEEYSQ